VQSLSDPRCVALVEGTSHSCHVDAKPSHRSVERLRSTRPRDKEQAMPTHDAVLADLLAYLRASPTPYHAAASAAARLEAAGFQRVDATTIDDLGPGRHYLIHDDSSLLAWVLPAAKTIRGFRLVGAHTDSPNLRAKPQAEVVKEGYVQLAVEVYGGALLNSWLDRDLALAGRVVVRGENGALTTKLVSLEQPLVRVPQLAIHLDREVTDKGLLLNKQTHMPPVVGLVGDDAFALTSLCATAAGVAEQALVATELMLFDTQGPAVGGARDEFLYSARLDNQAMCHASVAALVDAASAAESGDVVPFIALFDHEEVGSASATGAGSSYLARVLERIVLARGSRADWLRALEGSFFVSADMAHAVHPNYADRHDANHKPRIDGGPVIKVNAQQRYATSAMTGALFGELCRAVDVPFQHYVHRTDLPCGSTIGPIVATELGIPTVDVGNPMLSMHSIREMGGTRDAERMTRVLGGFLGALGARW
jgi:aspartyl aminopeptidase